MTFSLATIRHQGRPTPVIEAGDRYWSIEDVAPGLLKGNLARGLLNIFDDWNEAEQSLIALAADLSGGRSKIAPLQVAKDDFLTPLQYPNKLICVGANYYDHVHNDAGWTHFSKEKYVVPMFLKTPTTSLVGPGKTVRYPAHSKKVDWEIELAVVIGKRARKVPESEALKLIAGYTIGIDMSARDWQFHPRHLSKSDLFAGKSFDDSCPLGPRIVPARYLDGGHLSLRLSVNGQIKQNSNTKEMVWSLAEQISAISTHLTLEPGDVILTGTPAGVGLKTGTYLNVGDKVEAQIEGIGILAVEIIKDPDIIHSAYAEHSFEEQT
jgi:2-keto-4-pentenoate hydratase/2-oxohepta-3-ene-1,7-dioic acid hydratase in catechol pathway